MSVSNTTSDADVQNNSPLTVERLNALYEYSLEQVSALKSEMDMGFSAACLPIAGQLCQAMKGVPSYISLVQSTPHIAQDLQQIKAGKVSSLLKSLIELMCIAHTEQTPVPASIYGSLIIAITKLTDLSVRPILFKCGFKKFVNDEDRLLLIQNGFFHEFVAITEHLSSAKLIKYYLWALKADQVEFAEALIAKSDWPRTETLVPEKSLRKINKLYKKKLFGSDGPTETEWNTIGHILENYQCHGISVSLAVNRAFEVTEYSAVIRLYRGSKARFDGSSILGLELIKGKSQREQHYLHKALLTGEKDVVEHVLSQTHNVPGKTMSNIISTITSLVHGRHGSDDLAELQEMFYQWGEQHQCARVLLTGKTVRSKKSQDYWRLAGCEYSRQRILQELTLKLECLEEAHAQEVDSLTEVNEALMQKLAGSTAEPESKQPSAEEEQPPRPASQTSSEDAKSTGSDSGFDSGAETLTESKDQNDSE